MTKKIKTTISTTEEMKNKLQDQASKNGMDMSSYISHLVIMEERREKSQEAMEKMFTQMLPGGIKDLAVMAQLVQNKGDE